MATDNDVFIHHGRTKRQTENNRLSGWTQTAENLKRAYDNIRNSLWILSQKINWTNIFFTINLNQNVFCKETDFKLFLIFGFKWQENKLIFLHLNLKKYFEKVRVQTILFKGNLCIGPGWNNKPIWPIFNTEEISCK